MVTHSISSSNSKPIRGAFLLIEGMDRCGKTTQCSLLLKQMLSMSIASIAMSFPYRTTRVGEIIDDYLCTRKDMDDRAIHLLFSANRWEMTSKLTQNLANGKNIICDRYAYSGVAFTSAKSYEDRQKAASKQLSIDWCMRPDTGLPAPDAVIFLDMSPEHSERRGGYGEERYENRQLQIRVRQRFYELRKLDEMNCRVPWFIVDASKTIAEVQSDINNIVQETIKKVEAGSPLLKMFTGGEYKLPPRFSMED